MVEQLDKADDRLAGFVTAQIDIKERFGGDAQRQVHHLLGNVDGLPRLPGCQQLRCVIGHDRGIGVDPLGVKGRLLGCP